MAATPRVVVSKQTSYKGALKTWSNVYHFNGGTPADTAHWNTLFDAIVNAEKAVHLAGTVIVEAKGYVAGSNVAAATKSYSTAGTLSSSGITVPVVMAALTRYATTARTSKNHPIYLFQYTHGCLRDNASSDLEKLDPSQKTALETFADAWIAGFSDGTITAVRAGPNGATGTSRVVSDLLTHRDFRD